MSPQGSPDFSQAIENPVMRSQRMQNTYNGTANLDVTAQGNGGSAISTTFDIQGDDLYIISWGAFVISIPDTPDTATKEDWRHAHYMNRARIRTYDADNGLINEYNGATGDTTEQMVNPLQVPDGGEVEITYFNETDQALNVFVQWNAIVRDNS